MKTEKMEKLDSLLQHLMLESPVDSLINVSGEYSVYDMALYGLDVENGLESK